MQFFPIISSKNFLMQMKDFMTKIRSRIVNRDVLNQLAVSMGINKILISNVSSSHPTKNLYGDALEALIGSVFLDKGFKKTKKLFIKNVLNKYLDLECNSQY